MRYSCTEGIQLPFKVIPVIKELSGTRMQIDVKLRGTFSPKLFALNVVVRIPVPKYTGRTELLASYGKVKFDAAKNQVVWKIKKMAGGMEGHLACELGTSISWGFVCDRFGTSSWCTNLVFVFDPTLF